MPTTTNHGRILPCMATVTAYAMIMSDSLAAPPTMGEFLNPYPDSAYHGTDTPPPETPRSLPFRVTATSGGTSMVRVAYIIPSNRTPQTNGVTNLRDMVLFARNWFRDQMDNYGFGLKAFQYETEADGVTPSVRVVNVSETDSYLRGDLWSRTITAAANAGVSIWASGEVWLLVPEAHVQNADGSISGGTMLGASYGSGTDPGVAMLGSDALARWRADYLADDRSYDGMILTNIGPYALRQNVSFPWFEGSTLSSISSSVKGAMIHELAHAFGLPHDFRNDDNFHGDLMGNGLRGVRGCAFLGRYTNDYTDLTLGAARALNVSRYFGGSGAEDVKPNLTITTSGTVTPSNGHIRISYRASDASGLSGAHLKLNGDLIADMPLSGTNVSSSFSVPNLTPGSANALEISVWDIHGNRCNANTSVTPTTGANRAPIPKFRITQPVGVPGQMVTLDASGSSDPDHSSSSLTVEWDLDGDGVFETSPTSLKTISVPLSATGTRPVSVRVSDPLAARSTSASVALLTHRPALGISLTTVADSPLIEWFSKLGFLYYLERSFTLNMPDWRDRSPPGIIGDGGVQQFEDVLSAEDAAFYRLRVSLRDGN